MHCGQCGKAIDPDSRFCTNCGAKVPAPAASVPPPNLPTPQPGSTPSVAATSAGGAPFAGAAANAGASASAAAASMGAAATHAAHAASEALGKVDTQGLVARAKNILLTPRTEWPVISGEAKTAADVYMGYVAPLVAISAIAGALGMMLIGRSIPFIGTIRIGVGAAILQIVLQVVLTFVGLFVMSLIINALAPTFGGQKDSTRALKVAAYSFTPAWVAGILTIVPALGIIAGLLGLYGFYLLYLGLPVMMRSPQEKAMGYTIVTVLCAIVVGIVVSLVIGALMTAMGMGMSGAMGKLGASGADRGNAEVASALSSMMGGKSDADKQRVQDAMAALTKMGQQAEQAEKAAKVTGQDPKAAAAKSVDLNTALAAVGTMATGGKDVQPVDFHALKDLLPASIDGMQRSDASGQSGEAVGMKGSSATAHYANGAQGSLTLEVADIGSLAGLAGLAAKFNPNAEKETDNGYERTRTVNGQMMHQRYDRQSKSGEFGVMVGNRFAVTASGSNVSEATLTDAVKSVDIGKLLALAK